MEGRDEKTQIETTAELQALGLVMRITRPAWEKLMAYCQATNNEVSGFMIMERKGNELKIKDAYIAEQVSTGTSTEMTSTGISQLQMMLFKKGLIGKNDNIKLAHFHTHPTFGVFWSQTDMEMRATLRKGTDYYVSLVFNQKGEALAAIDINGEFPMSISNIPIEIISSDDIRKKCEEEVARLVKTPVLEQFSLGGETTGPRERKGKKYKDVRYLRELPWWRKERLEEQMAMGDVPQLIAGEVYQDERGVWENIGGEVVRTHDQNGDILLGEN